MRCRRGADAVSPTPGTAAPEPAVGRRGLDSPRCESARCRRGAEAVGICAVKFTVSDDSSSAAAAIRRGMVIAIRSLPAQFPSPAPSSRLFRRGGEGGAPSLPAVRILRM
jgi:hypothetical protein